PDVDRSGKPGVTAEKVEAFFAEIEAAHAWHQEATTNASTVLPLGDATAAAVAAYEAVRSKVDDYFARCKLAAFDPRVVAMLNRAETDYIEIAVKDLTLDGAEASHL